MSDEVTHRIATYDDGTVKHDIHYSYTGNGGVRLDARLRRVNDVFQWEITVDGEIITASGNTGINVAR